MKLLADDPAAYLAGDEIVNLSHPSITRLSDDGTSHVLHGLVAVYLQGSWHRQDPRGNKPGVDAQFSLTTERLAWPVRAELGERDYPQLLVSPHPAVVRALRGATDALELCRGGLPSHF